MTFSEEGGFILRRSNLFPDDQLMNIYWKILMLCAVDLRGGLETTTQFCRVIRERW